MIHNPNLKFFDMKVDPNIHSLDICCGYPSENEIFVKRGTVGVDIKEGFANHIMNAQDLKFEDNSFEVVSIYTSLDHIDNPLKALQEARRVSSKYVIVSMGNGSHFTRAFNDSPRDHLFQWNLSTLENIIIKAGLEPIEYNFENYNRKATWRVRLFEWTVRILFGGLRYSEKRKRGVSSLLEDVFIIKAVK